MPEERLERLEEKLISILATMENVADGLEEALLSARVRFLHERINQQDKKIKALEDSRSKSVQAYRDLRTRIGKLETNAKNTS